MMSANSGVPKKTTFKGKEKTGLLLTSSSFGDIMVGINVVPKPLNGPRGQEDDVENRKIEKCLKEEWRRVLYSVSCLVVLLLWSLTQNDPLQTRLILATSFAAAFILVGFAIWGLCSIFL